MENKPQEKWYFKTSALVVSFLCVGPFMLPLAWFNPRFSPKMKLMITIIITAFSYLLWVLLSSSLKTINSYYQAIL